MHQAEINKIARDLVHEGMTDLEIVRAAIDTVAKIDYNISASRMFSILSALILEMEAVRIARTPGN